MKITKSTRQNQMLRLIRDQVISTQDELVNALADRGMVVTQATVSRDMKELGIVKTTDNQGTQRFIALERTNDATNDRLFRVFSEAVVGAKQAMNILVIHTLPGMASATGAALDAMDLNEVAGTVCGDDTIFVACTEIEAARDLQLRLAKIHKSIASDLETRA